MSQSFLAQIRVTLRPSVLDPAGTAVRSSLQQLGYDEIESVRVGKYIEVRLRAADPTAAQSQVDALCDRLLANPVIETYTINLVADA